MFIASQHCLEKSVSFWGAERAPASEHQVSQPLSLLLVVILLVLIVIPIVVIAGPNEAAKVGC